MSIPETSLWPTPGPLEVDGSRDSGMLETFRPIFFRLDASDIQALMKLEHLCFPTPWAERQFKMAFEMNLFYVFGFKEAGRLLGYVSFYCTGEEMEILNLAVAPEYRRRGLASRLLGLVLKIGKRLGVARVFLEVRESNVAARALYSRLGFGQVGVRKGYYPDNREDALVQRLNL